MTPRNPSYRPPADLDFVRVHTLIGIDANGHLCSACGRIPSFTEHLAALIAPALAA